MNSLNLPFLIDAPLLASFLVAAVTMHVLAKRSLALSVVGRIASCCGHIAAFCAFHMRPAEQGGFDDAAHARVLRDRPIGVERVRSLPRLILGCASVVLSACSAGINQSPSIPPPALVPALGGHQWSSDRHDSLGTLRAATRLNATTKPVVLWDKVLANQLSGSPAVSTDGTIYIASSDKRLHALTPSGELIWSALLDFAPVGAVALSVSGEVAVADDQGGITTFDAQGNGRWGYRPAQLRRALSGPVFDADGNAYLAQDGYLVSVDPRGVERWTSRLPYTYFSPVPRVDGRFVFFKDLVFSARTGKILVAESPDDLDQFITGADGKLYLMSQSRLLEWQASADSAALAAVRTYDWTKRFPAGNPSDATIWSDGGTWLMLTTGTYDSRLIWVNPQGEVAGTTELPVFGGRIIGIGEDGLVYACGEVSGREIRCDAVQPGTDKAVWSQTLPVEPFIGEYRDQPMVIGGALLPDKLLIATLSGKLYALGDPAIPVAAAASPTPALVPVTPAVPQAAPDAAQPTIAVAVGATVIVTESQGFFPVEPTVALPTPFPTLALTLSPDATPEPVIDATAVPTDATAAPTAPAPGETATPTQVGAGLDPQACEVSKATTLRQVPSPIGTELAALDVGAKVSLLSRERDNAWAYVRVGRRVGWVLVAETTCGGP
jgi:outer membrane protein assembly factor BamB